MPLGLDPVSAGIGGVTTVAKLGLAAYQAYKAGQLRVQDTTTPEQREALQIARQRAASLSTPGQAMLEDRLAQTQGATVSAARLGAGSGSDYLASVSAADATRQGGEMQLGVQREQYNGRAQQELQQQLGLEAQQRQHDLAVFNQQKSSLTGAAIQNANSAIDNGAAYAAYSLDRGGNGDGTGYGAGAVDEMAPRAIMAQLPGASLAPGIRGTGLPGYAPGFAGGRYAAYRNRYGLTY